MDVSNNITTNKENVFQSFQPCATRINTIPAQSADSFAPSEPQQKPKNIKKIQIYLAAGAAAVGASAMFVATRGKFASLKKVFEKQIEDLSSKISTLGCEKTVLEDAANKAKVKINELQQTLSDIPDNVIVDCKKDAEKLLKETREQISRPLSYDALHPPIDCINQKERYSIDQYFSHTLVPAESSIRKHLPDFRPPSRQEIIDRGSLTFEVPIERTSNIKVTRSPDASDIQCVRENIGKFVETDVKMSYGNNVKWSEQKVARDIMQNFYDGHGHTLEGVKVSVDYNPATKSYKVRVSGEGEYNHRNIEAFGAGTKSEDPRNAGGFGEGAKVMTVKMLQEFKVPEVRFASSNWKVLYQSGSKGFMTRKVEAVGAPIKGNYVEFETTNAKLVDSVLDSTNYFYHPQNPDFKGLTFENDHFGFKLIGDNPKIHKGNIYLTQRFEYNDTGHWNNSVENLHIIFKRKPIEDGVIEANRDRIKITANEIEKLSEHFADTLSPQDLAKAISSLERIWVRSRDGKTETAGIKFLEGLVTVARRKNVYLEFSANQKFVAVPQYSNYSNDILRDFVENGYTICHGFMNKVGVKDADTLLKELRNHGALPPTKIESKKLQIINEAALALANSMEKSGLKKVVPSIDAAKPTYLFERHQKDSTLAEAIIKGRKYLGHWIARDYLNKAEFSEVVATRLHEICHQYGGDGESRFGYKLTDVMADYNEILTTDPAIRQKLAVLRKLWNEHTPKN